MPPSRWPLLLIDVQKKTYQRYVGHAKWHRFECDELIEDPAMIERMRSRPNSFVLPTDPEVA